MGDNRGTTEDGAEHYDEGLFPGKEEDGRRGWEGIATGFGGLASVGDSRPPGVRVRSGVRVCRPGCSVPHRPRRDAPRRISRILRNPQIKRPRPHGAQRHASGQPRARARRTSRHAPSVGQREGRRTACERFFLEAREGEGDANRGQRDGRKTRLVIVPNRVVAWRDIQPPDFGAAAGSARVVRNNLLLRVTNQVPGSSSKFACC